MNPTFHNRDLLRDEPKEGPSFSNHGVDADLISPTSQSSTSRASSKRSIGEKEDVKLMVIDKDTFVNVRHILEKLERGDDIVLGKISIQKSI